MIVAIVGAESTGKSDLVLGLQEVLARRGLRCGTVGEYLREWCDGTGRTPHAHEQAAIAAEQQRRIEAAAAAHDLVVADTTPLMTAIYSELLFSDTSLYAAAIDWHRARVAATLVTALDLPWRADGLQRDGPHVREPVDARLRAALAGAAIPFSVVHGDGDARAAAALAALRPLLPAADDDARAPRLRPRCPECLDPGCEQLLHRRK
jgi:nicotinamide riboside kinase